MNSADSMRDKLAIFEQRPWSRPVHLEQTPIGMLGDAESALFYHLTQSYFSGAGTVIDAGSFLGKSAFYLASGMRDNPKVDATRHRVHCFDLFEVNHPSTIDYIRRTLGQETRIGDSTTALFERQVAPVRELLEVHKGDFMDAHWPSGEIEILMVDIAKTAALGRKVMELFFTHLIPGKSLVIHQDYHHPWHPYIHVTMEYLGESFRLVEPRADGSAVFFLRAPLDPEALRRAIEFDFTREEILQLLARAIERIPHSQRDMVCLVDLLVRMETEDPSAALIEADRVSAEFARENADPQWHRCMRDIRLNFVTQDGWKQYRVGNFELGLARADELIRADSSSESGRWLRASCLRGLRRPTQAEADLRSLLASDRFRGSATLDLAEILLDSKRAADAEQILLQGLSSHAVNDPTLGDRFALLARTWRLLGDHQRALAHLAKLQPHFRTAPGFWLLDAEVRSMSNRRAHSSASLREARRHGLPGVQMREAARRLGLTDET
ncbi:MAG: class I SAM-dependent methyltransferase [Planctomycetota bacterium]